MAKYNKRVTEKLKQADVDDWMCEQLNKIINYYFDDRTTGFTTSDAFLEMAHVLYLANRRKKQGDKNDIPFSDYSRSNYKFSPV